MVRPEEVLIVPVPSGATIGVTPTAEQTIPIETTPPEPQIWQLWWSMFFDTEPPTFGS
jgi:hypothetical protein